MQLAFIRQSYRPDGGAERILERTLSAMSGRDICPTIITRHWLEKGAFEVVSDPGRYRTRTAREKGFAKFACGIVKNRDFDLVQSHERIPCCDIYRAGDGVHREWLAQRARIKGALVRRMTDISLYHTTIQNAEAAVFSSPRLKAVICNSRMVSKEIQCWFGYPEQHLHVIYNGVDHNRFSPDTRTQRRAVFERLGIPGRPFVFLFVGSGFQRKGLVVALEALARLPQSSSLIVVGRDKKLGYYQTLAKRLGVASRVYFCGAKQDVSAYYGAADALLLPTLYDPFPNVCTEAFASGLPVITSEKCGAAELIETGKNGFVSDALDVQAFTEYMTAAMDHGRDYYTDAAVATVKAFSLDTMVNKMVSLYDRVLEQS